MSYESRMSPPTHRSDVDHVKMSHSFKWR